MTTASTIRLIPPRLFKPGNCAICGEPALLKWRDHEVGCVGDCCYESLVSADRLLAAELPRPTLWKVIPARAVNFRKPSE